MKMRMSVNVGVFVFLSILVCVQGCPEGFQEFKTQCYGYVDQKMIWTDAQSTCAALGGFVAEIFSPEEGKFVRDFAIRNGQHTVGLGADDLLAEGLWSWSRSGLPLNFTDWHHGQPKDDTHSDCLEMEFDRFEGQWNDNPCDHKHRFICQRPKPQFRG